jgi:hypothetical protein
VIILIKYRGERARKSERDGTEERLFENRRIRRVEGSMVRKPLDRQVCEVLFSCSSKFVRRSKQNCSAGKEDPLLVSLSGERTETRW